MSHRPIFFLFTCLISGWFHLSAQVARNPNQEMAERLATPEPLPFGPTLMKQVRDNLPSMPLRLTGEIRTRSDEGKTTRRLTSELHFGSTPPYMTFALYDAFGAPLERFRVSWGETDSSWARNGSPVEMPENLVDTGLNGSDLALEFLWWPGAEVTGLERVRARDAYVVRIPSPGRQESVRLWIDKRALFVVAAETLNQEGEVLRRLEVDKLKKIREDLWMVQDLVVRDREMDRTIKIRFDDVEELEK
jgi:hypothetical protein